MGESYKKLPYNWKQSWVGPDLSFGLETEGSLSSGNMESPTCRVCKAREIYGLRYPRRTEMVDFGHVPGHFHMNICPVPTSRPGLVCHRLERKSAAPGRTLLWKGRTWMEEKGGWWTEDTPELVIFLRSKQTKTTTFSTLVIPAF